MTTIVIFNCKGGVGKTTTAVNLAAAYALSTRQPVALIDLDPQCHLTSTSELRQVAAADSVYSFFTNERSLVSLAQEWEDIGWLIPAHGQLMKLDSVLGRGPAALKLLSAGLSSLQPKMPLVVIDCCPYVGVLSLNAIFAADLLVVPVSADHLSFLGAQQVEKTLKALEPILKKRLKRRYLLTRHDPEKRIGNQVFETMRESFGNETCSSVIRESIAIVESPIYHKDVLHYAPDSYAADDYLSLYRELLNQGLFASEGDEILTASVA